MIEILLGYMNLFREWRSCHALVIVLRYVNNNFIDCFELVIVNLYCTVGEIVYRVVLYDIYYKRICQELHFHVIRSLSLLPRIIDFFYIFFYLFVAADIRLKNIVFKLTSEKTVEIFVSKYAGGEVFFCRVKFVCIYDKEITRFIKYLSLTQEIFISPS